MQQPLVSESLVDLFNQAAALAREGNHADALELWNAIIAPKEKPHPSIVATIDFLGQTHLRRAWSLTDLGRFTEAKAVFESEFMRSALGQFDLRVLFDYFFSYANVLGELGEIKRMDDKFSRALNIAADRGDAFNAQLCWLNLMHYAELHNDWEYLEREARSCIRFADNSDLPKLGLAAGLKRSAALVKLNLLDKAGQQARRVVKLSEQLEDADAGAAAQAFLKELEAAPQNQGQPQ